jgi:hypothetical protein
MMPDRLKMLLKVTKKKYKSRIKVGFRSSKRLKKRLSNSRKQLKKNMNSIGDKNYLQFTKINLKARSKTKRLPRKKRIN